MQVVNQGGDEIPVAGFMCCGKSLWHNRTVDKTGKDLVGGFGLNCSVCNKHVEKTKSTDIPEQWPDMSDEEYNRMCMSLVAFNVDTDLLFELAELWQEKYKNVKGLYCVDGEYIITEGTPRAAYNAEVGDLVIYDPNKAEMVGHNKIRVISDDAELR